MKRTLKRRNPPPTEASVGILEEPTCSTSGEGLRDLGKIWRCAPESSSRRLEDGTYGRIVDPKQGRSRWQPRSGRRAKTHRITSDPGKSGGVFETGGSGRSSAEVRDNITLTERRTRGPRRSLKQLEAWSADNADRRKAGGHEGDEGDVKLVEQRAYADLTLELVALPGRATLTDEAPWFEAVLGKTQRTEF
jgi:hypothetical protein